MSHRFLQFAFVCLVAVTAHAQSGAEDRVCTDLSGKVRLTCPREPQPDAAARNGATKTSREASETSPQESSAASGHAPPSPVPSDDPEPVPAVKNSPRAEHSFFSLERSLPRNFMADQKSLWTSPLRLRVQDTSWLLPLAGATAVVVLSDGDIERKLPTSASFIRQSKSFSDYGAAAYAGMVGGAYLWSRATSNDHLRETAILSGEAALDSLLVTEGVKYMAGRERPFEGDGTGSFRRGGSSFPSLHSAGAWAIASVVAREYPGPLTQLFAYGGAAAISAARVTGRQHFASDVLVGSAIGWYLGRQVYNAHADRNDLDASYGSFERTRGERGPVDAADMGSSYVPLDSWVYPAIDRLVALGYVRTAFAGLRPWTRMECARLLSESPAAVSDDASKDRMVADLYGALAGEFAAETQRLSGQSNVGVEVDSIYTRVTGISGKPLSDSYHFAESVTNDSGRPYQEGTNLVSGFTARAEAGPLAFYIQGEYQHSPSAAAYPLNVRQAISSMDSTPIQDAIPFPAHDDFRLLDAYVALNVKGNQFSFGRQSIWWGPGEGGALMFSDNARPMYMLRWNRVVPTRLPSFLGWLGPVRTEFFVGKLEGHRYPASPYISAQKVSFKPTPNLELGFSKLSVFAGGGIGIGWKNFIRATFNYNDANPNLSNLPGIDPGDRRSGFNFSYRIPGVRNWLTLYAEALSDDDPSPLASPRRAAMNPGIYLSHFPGLARLDFRAEGVYTDTPSNSVGGGKFIYWNGIYRDSHTNAGQLMGSWVGRDGRGVQLSGRYSFSARNTVQVGYRALSVSPDFVPSGGTLADYAVHSDWMIRSDVSINANLQYEQWSFPLLSPVKQGNMIASVNISYWPRWLRK